LYSSTPEGDYSIELFNLAALEPILLEELLGDLVDGFLSALNKIRFGDLAVFLVNFCRYRLVFGDLARFEDVPNFFFVDYLACVDDQLSLVRANSFNFQIDIKQYHEPD
jgi:hypothetical protein